MKLLRILLCLLLAAGAVACSDFFNGSEKTSPPGEKPRPTGGANPFEPGFDPNAPPFSEGKMLANIALNVIAPLAKDFRLRAEILQSEIRRLCAGLDQGSQAVTEEQDVRREWTRAMLVYHQLDAVPVGPLDESGRLLSDSIYGWPSFNACGVDLEVVKLSETGTAPARLLFTLKGLGALEYLFFDSKLGTQCNPANLTHRPAFVWTQKPVLEKRKDRCHLANHLAADLVVQAKTLEAAWDPAGANFSKTLMDGSRYSSLHEAVNAMSNALFGVEEVKDLRLGRPLGLHKDCLSPDGKCPEAVEHSFSGLAVQAIGARLQAFRDAFFGSKQPGDARFGFDDNLALLGRADVASRILSAVNLTLQTLPDVEAVGPLATQIRNMDKAQCKETVEGKPLVTACLLHHRVRQVSTILKTEFLTALSLKAPPTHQGDND